MGAAANLLSELAAVGVSLWVDGDRLRYRTSSGSLSPAHRERLATHKPELMALLVAPVTLPEHAALLDEWRQLRERWARGLELDAQGYGDARQEAAAYRSFSAIAGRVAWLWETLTAEAPALVPAEWLAEPLPE